MEAFIQKLNKDWDIFTKIRALYIFTGLHYYYDPLYIYGKLEQKKEIYKINNDIKMLDDKYIICNGWAHKYKKLLDELEVKSEIKGDFHLYILIYIDNFIIRADMSMAPYFDFMNIKLGFETLHYSLQSGNEEEFKKRIFEADKKIGYIKENYNNETVLKKLSKLKEKLKNKSLLFKYTELFNLFDGLLEEGFIEKLNLIKYLQEHFFSEHELSLIHGTINIENNILTNTVEIDDTCFIFSDNIKKLNKI